MSRTTLLSLALLAGCGPAGNDLTPVPGTSSSSSDTSAGAATPVVDPLTAGIRDHSAELAPGDDTLESGEYADIYTVDVKVGQTLVIDLVSTSDLDPYLILRSPSDVQYENDDYMGDRTRAHLEKAVTEPGTWRVMATTFEPGEAGTYKISIRTQTEPPAEDAEPAVMDDETEAAPTAI